MHRENIFQAPQQQWRTGQVVATSRWWGLHVGVVVGSDTRGSPMVAHCSFKLGEVAVETMAAFSGGKPVFDRALTSDLTPAAIVRRAYEAVGRRYSFREFNCEDFVGHALGLPPRSPQREALYALCAAVTTITLVLRAAR